MTAETILSYFRANTELLKILKVKRIGLFGSYSRGQQNAASDIDILVEYVPGGKSFDNFITLIDKLEANLNKTVTVVTPESISNSFYDHIQPDLQYVEISY